MLFCTLGQGGVIPGQGHFYSFDFYPALLSHAGRVSSGEAGNEELFCFDFYSLFWQFLPCTLDTLSSLPYGEGMEKFSFTSSHTALFWSPKITVDTHLLRLTKSRDLYTLTDSPPTPSATTTAWMLSITTLSSRICICDLIYMIFFPANNL